MFTNDDDSYMTKIGVVIVDVQNDFCEVGGYAWNYADDRESLISATNKIKDLIETAKDHNFPCFFVRSYFDEKYKLPTLIEKHRDLQINEVVCREGSWGAEFCDVFPNQDDPIVTKHTSDSFLYTFLEPLLRKYNISTIILSGFLTEICVLETGRSALQRGFRVLIPQECTSGLYQSCVVGALDELKTRGAKVFSLDSMLKILVSEAKQKRKHSIGHIEGSGSREFKQIELEFANPFPTKNNDEIKIKNNASTD